MSYGIIYKATNIINGKVYIGQTTNTINRRRTEHYYNAMNGDSNQVFYRAIRKYGKDSFSWEIIDKADTKKELCEKEIYWIEYYNSYIGKKDCNGYNMSIGGETNKGAILSKETRRKMSVSRAGKGNAMYGRKMTDAQKERLRKIATSENNPTNKPVIKLSLDGKILDRYHSCAESARAIGGDTSHIASCCRGERLVGYGYLWLYEDDYDEGLVKERIKILNKSKKNLNISKRKKVVQLSLDGKFIKSFNSISDAEMEVTGKIVCAIGRCCRGKAKTYKGFKWMYEEDYLALEGVVNVRLKEN